MLHNPTYRPWLAFTAGLLISVFAGGAYSLVTNHSQVQHSHDTEYHVHADFALYINGERYDLSAERFMSGSEQVLHEHVHLHDENGDVIHYHAPDISLAEFLASLSFTLTDTCLTTPEGSEYCTSSTSTLQLYVNNEPSSELASYVAADEDRLLLYYGAPDVPSIPEFLDSVSDRACIYSYTCPERGVPPPESCGLTCEL